MTTVDLSNYSLYYLEFILSAIAGKYTKNEYIVKYNSKNELTLYFKDEYKHLYFTLPNLKKITHIYCAFETKEEMQIYLDLLEINLHNQSEEMSKELSNEKI
jgi:hypothetical protein